MNRLVVIVLFLLGPVALNGLISCDTCNPTPYRFGISNYQVYPRRLISSALYKYYLTDTLANHDSVSFNQLELILIGQERQVALDNCQTNGFSVYACSPTEIPVDSISNLSISSSQPYITGSTDNDVSALVTIGSGANDQEPLANFTTKPIQFAFPFYSLQFQQPPTQAGWYSFTGSVQLKSGIKHHFTSRPIYIRG